MGSAEGGREKTDTLRAVGVPTCTCIHHHPSMWVSGCCHVCLCNLYEVCCRSVLPGFCRAEEAARGVAVVHDLLLLAIFSVVRVCL
jgi:hypothetical protein